MTRERIGDDLASCLFSAETAIDAALVETANLAAALPVARSRAYLSATTGQQAFEGAAASLTALTEARAHLISTHRTLAAIARKLGLEVVAAGPMDKPEDETPIGGGGVGRPFRQEQA